MEEVKLRRVGFVKRIGFKPGVIEREGVMDVQSGESEKEEVTVPGVYRSLLVIVLCRRKSP